MQQQLISGEGRGGGEQGSGGVWEAGVEETERRISNVPNVGEIAICCSSKNSSNLLFSQFNYFDSCNGDETIYGRDFTEVNHSKLTSLHATTFLV